MYKCDKLVIISNFSTLFFYYYLFFSKNKISKRIFLCTKYYAYTFLVFALKKQVIYHLLCFFGKRHIIEKLEASKEAHATDGECGAK